MFVASPKAWWWSSLVSILACLLRSDVVVANWCVAPYCSNNSWSSNSGGANCSMLHVPWFGINHCCSSTWSWSNIFSIVCPTIYVIRNAHYIATPIIWSTFFFPYCCACGDAYSWLVLSCCICAMIFLCIGCDGSLNPVCVCGFFIFCMPCIILELLVCRNSSHSVPFLCSSLTSNMFLVDLVIFTCWKLSWSTAMHEPFSC